MSYYYEIKIQFVDPNADFSDPSTMEAIASAVTYYNQKSMIATNPKNIESFKLHDNSTLILILQSKTELPYPGKALQTFSRFLIDPENEFSMQRFIRGNSIFKMSSKLIDTQAPHQSPNFADDSMATLKLKAISVILTISSEKQQQLEEVVKLLEGGEHAYNYGSDKGN